MKKIITFAVTVLLFSVSSFASAASGGWYFISEGRNERPRLPTVENKSAKGIGKEEKVLYLTFDAGYENGNVAKILDVLHAEQVSGAFFILGNLIERNPELGFERSFKTSVQ